MYGCGFRFSNFYFGCLAKLKPWSPNICRPLAWNLLWLPTSWMRPNLIKVAVAIILYVVKIKTVLPPNDPISENSVHVRLQDQKGSVTSRPPYHLLDQMWSMWVYLHTFIFLIAQHKRNRFFCFSTAAITVGKPADASTDLMWQGCALMLTPSTLV